MNNPATPITPIVKPRFFINLNTFTTWTKMTFTIVFFLFYLSIFVYSSFSKNYVPNYAMLRDFLTNQESLYANFHRYIKTVMKENMKNTISSFEDKLKKVKDNSKANMEAMYRENAKLQEEMTKKCPNKSPSSSVPSFLPSLDEPPLPAMSCARSREKFVPSRVNDGDSDDDNDVGDEKDEYSMKDYINRVLLNTLYVKNDTIYSK